MAGPFVFIATHRIREGKLGEFNDTAAELARIVEEHEPQMVSFNFFMDESESEVTVVQVHPDADSMLIHMKVGLEQITKGVDELLETKAIEIYGEPNEMVLGMIEHLSQSGTPITVKPRHHSGFTRGT